MRFAAAITAICLSLATLGQETSTLKFISISPSSQMTGGPIAIKLFYPGKNPANPDDVSVSFDGVEARVSKIDQSSDSLLISVITPSELTESNALPTIRVRVGDEGLTIPNSFKLVLRGQGTPTPDTTPLWYEKLFDKLGVITGLGTIIVLLLVITGYLIVRIRRQNLVHVDASRVVASQITKQDQSPDSRQSTEVESSPDYTVPYPPDSLKAAVARGQCVIVVGSGMNALGGLMSWGEILGEVVNNALDNKEASYYRRELDNGRIDSVAESLRSVIGVEDFAKMTHSLIPKSFDNDSPYTQLRSIGFGAMVNLNYDTLLADALDNPTVLSHKDARRCLDLLSRGEPFVLQLNGSVDRNDMLLSNQDVQDTVAKNDSLRDVLRLFYYSRTLLFIGVSLEGVQNFFRLIDRSSQESGTHYALIMAPNDSFDIQARSLIQFGVEVLPFGAASRDHAITDFLNELRELSDHTISPDKQNIQRITAVELRNIGPFVEERFEFDDQWNVILGDNGVGKSTILKAIAVAVTGKRSSEYADRLLRSKEDSGEIVLFFGQRKYLTTLNRDSDGAVLVESLSGSPYQLEEMLITGFSAMRSIGWEVPKDRGQSGAARPTADDILPLLSGERDPRLQGVKQLILRLHHSIESTGTPEDDKIRYKALWESLFDMFRDLTKGVPIDPGSIDPQAGKIYINTQDGEVPLENLSQGTLSIISWTGALLQRLSEISRRGEDPHDGAAVVLVDEIDAHMHPAWQRALARLLSEIFPNAQFIVTSHSPLMVGGLDTDQVYRLARGDDDRVIVERPEYALRGLGAAGLLTSNLFGLETHLDEHTETRLNRKSILATKILKKTITNEEQDELKNLDKELGVIDFTRSHRVPPYEKNETPGEDENNPLEILDSEEDKRERMTMIEDSLEEIIKTESDEP